jgi:integrase
MTLAQARTKAQEARELLAQGIDPAEQRDAAKTKQRAVVLADAVAAERAAKKLAPAGTLLGVAEDYHANKLATKDWAELHATQWIQMVRRCLPGTKQWKEVGGVVLSDTDPNVVRDIAYMPIGAVKAKHLLASVIVPQEKAGKVAQARTVRKYLAEVFAWAELNEISVGNPATGARAGMMKKGHKKLGNNPAVITPPALREVLLAIREWTTTVTRAALMVEAALFQRPGTTCSMRWPDIDLDAAVWTIKAEVGSKIENSLGGDDHLVPLPKQVVELIRSLKPLTGRSKYVFESPNNPGLPITNDTLTNALRNMGFGDKQTAHGFRATARTMIPKYLGPKLPAFDKDWVEAQLAHKTSEEMGTAYDRNRWFEERGLMLQAWADYLDQLLTQQPAQLVEQPVPAEPLLLAAA